MIKENNKNNQVRHFGYFITNTKKCLNGVDNLIFLFTNPDPNLCIVCNVSFSAPN